MVCSIVTYNAVEEKARQERQSGADPKSLEVFLIPPRDWRGRSYRSLLRPLEEEGLTSLRERGLVHDPNYLDDPKMAHGSSRQESRGDAKRGPIIFSIIQFKNKRELKEQLNEQFRDRHPQLPPSLTFSKIRNLKKSLLLGCLALDVEVSTAAYAYVCFERLCLKGIVTKTNRHLTMAVCLVLAFKFLEPLTGNSSRIDSLMSFVDREWEVSRKEVFEAEFGVFVQLGFLLHLPTQHVFIVYSKLLKLIHRSSRSYLGDAMSAVYSSDARMIEQMARGNRSEQPEEDDFEDPQQPEDSGAEEGSAVEESSIFNRRPFFRKNSFPSLGALLTGGSEQQGDGQDSEGLVGGTPILTILGFTRKASLSSAESAAD